MAYRCRPDRTPRSRPTSETDWPRQPHYLPESPTARTPIPLTDETIRHGSPAERWLGRPPPRHRAKPHYILATPPMSTQSRVEIPPPPPHLYISIHNYSTETHDSTGIPLSRLPGMDQGVVGLIGGGGEVGEEGGGGGGRKQDMSVSVWLRCDRLSKRSYF